MNTDAVRRDLGEILAHGEPETGMGQGEAAETNQPPADTPNLERPPPRSRPRAQMATAVVTVDFGGLGPAAA